MPRLCKHCGSDEHTAFYCKAKPRTPIKRGKKPINRFGKQARQWSTFRKLYLEAHLPNAEGYYECYLQTVPECPRWLLPEQVTLDHKKSRSGNPQLRFNEENIGISCFFCNGHKGSLSLEKYLEMVKNGRK